MWALVHHRKQAERLRMKGRRDTEKAKQEAANQKKRERYALVKEGRPSKHYLYLYYLLIVYTAAAAALPTPPPAIKAAAKFQD